MSGKIEVTRKPNLYHTREINEIYYSFLQMSKQKQKEFLEYFQREIISKIKDRTALDFILQIFELLSEKGR